MTPKFCSTHMVVESLFPGITRAKRLNERETTQLLR